MESNPSHVVSGFSAALTSTPDPTRSASSTPARSPVTSSPAMDFSATPTHGTSGGPPLAWNPPDFSGGVACCPGAAGTLSRHCSASDRLLVCYISVIVRERAYAGRFIGVSDATGSGRSSTPARPRCDSVPTHPGTESARWFIKISAPLYLIHTTTNTAAAATIGNADNFCFVSPDCLGLSIAVEESKQPESVNGGLSTAASVCRRTGGRVGDKAGKVWLMFGGVLF